jgi:hypothetical protein
LPKTAADEPSVWHVNHDNFVLAAPKRVSCDVSISQNLLHLEPKNSHHECPRLSFAPPIDFA